MKLISFVCLVGQRRYLVAELPAAAATWGMWGMRQAASGSQLQCSFPAVKAASCASYPCNLAACLKKPATWLLRWQLGVWVSWHLATTTPLGNLMATRQHCTALCSSFLLSFHTCVHSILCFSLSPPLHLHLHLHLLLSISLSLWQYSNFFRSILLGVCSFTRNCIHGMQRHQREAWQLHKPPPHTQHSFLFSFFHFHFFLGSSRSPLSIFCVC